MVESFECNDNDYVGKKKRGMFIVIGSVVFFVRERTREKHITQITYRFLLGLF